MPKQGCLTDAEAPKYNCTSVLYPGIGGVMIAIFAVLRCKEYCDDVPLGLIVKRKDTQRSWAEHCRRPSEICVAPFQLIPSRPILVTVDRFIDDHLKYILFELIIWCSGIFVKTTCVAGPTTSIGFSHHHEYLKYNCLFSYQLKVRINKQLLFLPTPGPTPT
ncbi:hypothetical protein B0J11DRAFT_127029 [Dendryphion nanum]|uniref:Uncharacterized protein n=1 Tax=Dendryphion nanum TaxID=256645 RepID=A0A9P9D9S8_9PLEO|nr:hypothetical protein B0J11DRAFT_127029 [Dendryphion nanum]